MSETALWLNYCLAGLISFTLVYGRGWRITSAILVATAIAAAGWTIAVTTVRSPEDDTWFGFALFVNVAFAFVFAGAAAWVAKYLALTRD